VQHRVGIGNPNDVVLVRDAWGRLVRMPLEQLPSIGGSWQLGGVQTARSLTISAEEKNVMQAQVRQFETDVETLAGNSTSGQIPEAVKYLDRVAQQSCFVSGNAWDAVNKTCLLGTPDPQHATYPKGAFAAALVAFRESRLEPFVNDWYDFLTGFGSSIGVADFEALKIRFQDLVAEWRGLGQQTSAVPPPVSAPGGAFETAADWLPWVLGGAALIAVGVFVLPAIMPLVAAANLGGKK
jgi:hypothetical protein